jgi:enamine deaminase RidA (YjgF/YER057c/UK114 family)
MGNPITKESGHSRIKQKYIQLTPGREESISDFCLRIARSIGGEGYHLVKATCFGSLQYQHEFETEFIKYSQGQFPLTWVEGANCTDVFMNGIHIWAVKDTHVDYFSSDFNIRACKFEDDNAQYLYAGNILSEPLLAPALSCARLFDYLEGFLNKYGFSFNHVKRTWYYLDGILNWYEGFNKIRTDFFKRTGANLNLLPASTGVGGSNMIGSPVTMELLAIKSKYEQSVVSRIVSPLQREATDYGSSFSRGIIIKSKGYEFLSISGTASILPNGETAHIGELGQQIRYTFNVIEKILQQEGYKLENAVKAIAYIKNKDSFETLQTYLGQNYNGQISFIITEGTICRENLLFEIELDLMKDLRVKN